MVAGHRCQDTPQSLRSLEQVTCFRADGHPVPKENSPQHIQKLDVVNSVTVKRVKIQYISSALN